MAVVHLGSSREGEETEEEDMVGELDKGALEGGAGTEGTTKTEQALP